MFIELHDKLINLDNVSQIFKERNYIVFYFNDTDSRKLKYENEEELNKAWEWLKGVCLEKAGEQDV